MLYLASSSSTRHHLMSLADIPFRTVSHQSDECSVVDPKNFDQYVLSISKDKMAHVVIPADEQGTALIVMTADTLVKTAQTHQVLGKPNDIEHARQILAQLRAEPAEVITAVCIQKRSYDGDSFTVEDEREIVVRSTIEFVVPEDEVERYFDEQPDALLAAGAAKIEDAGLQYLKHFEGSFSAVMGLPLFEVKQALKEMG